MSRRNELRLGLMFLTRFPAGRLDSETTLSQAAWTFPLVGLVPGAFGWATFALAGGGALGAALAVTAGALATGALHWDGLADFADGMGGGRDREHVLEIMRDSRIGSYGVLAMILCAVLQILALAEIGSLTAFLFAAVSSRLLMVDLLMRLPPARGDGLGASGAGSASFWPGCLLAAALGLALGLDVIAAVIGGLVAWAVVKAVSRKRIGGQTGDVCGAVQLIAETAILVALAVAA